MNGGDVRRALRRSSPLRSAVHRGRELRLGARRWRQLVSYLAGGATWDDLPDDVAIRLAYQLLLGREPDDGGRRTFANRLAHGTISRRSMLANIMGSSEFANHTAFSELGPSIHFGRGVFVRSLPSARRILDLGGSGRNCPAGAMVAFGYPYAFDELVVVDLPSGERHELYRDDVDIPAMATGLGPVTFRYHSMVDLGGLPDASFDLVYSGQSIEHVTESDGDKVLAEVHRVLRPGGHLALDTPNGTVCRLRQDEFIDPDHEIEYTHAQLSAKLTDAGFSVVRAEGLNHAGASVAAGRFDLADTARHWGPHADLERCYILCYLARKPPQGGGAGTSGSS